VAQVFTEVGVVALVLCSWKTGWSPGRPVCALKGWKRFNAGQSGAKRRRWSSLPRWPAKVTPDEQQR
jgi:hypothetical protein